MKQKPDLVKASGTSTSQAKGQTQGRAVVAKSNAVILVVLGILGGFFIGWQGATMYLTEKLERSREAALGQGGPAVGTASPGQMPAGMPGGKPGQMPPQMPGGMPGQMPGGPGAELMAQAKALEAKVAANPNDIESLVSLANLYFDQDLHDKAIATYERALKLKNDMPDVWTDLGVMYRADKRFQDALAAFRKAIALDPRHEIARINTGIVLMIDMNDKAGALKAWNDLLAIDPEARMPDGRRLADVVREVSK